MTKKEKSKFNPFAQVLHPDEEILWLYKPPIASETIETLKAAFRVVILLFFGFLVAVCAHLVVQTLVMRSYGFLDISQMTLSQFVRVAAFTAFYGVGMLYPLSRLRVAQNQAYAVTNKRLLTSVAEKVTSLILEDVDMLQMSSSEEGHLFFSSSMPEWRHIPHPEEVIKIIQQAKHMRRLEMAHEDNYEDEHGEETEEQVQSLRTGASSR